MQNATYKNHNVMRATEESSINETISLFMQREGKEKMINWRMNGSILIRPIQTKWGCNE
ncbi:hypothetical protein [Anaeromicropila herbilytica]|uniref:Uncharacterized protein n=1 Tax=Anaeromicropila herbilytica TaxID=2785025 RepID=A0A7R7IDU3_9FIRM|nr:hypothetical protein [Anaeromicropila herbilytica]BCN32073.1 hypothetical protein bsdtb5_33680 [Anaeromicropila herbilytica]